MALRTRSEYVGRAGEAREDLRPVRGDLPDLLAEQGALLLEVVQTGDHPPEGVHSPPCLRPLRRALRRPPLPEDPVLFAGLLKSGAIVTRNLPTRTQNRYDPARW